MCPTSIHGFDFHLYPGDDGLLDGLNSYFVFFSILVYAIINHIFSALSSSTFENINITDSL